MRKLLFLSILFCALVVPAASRAQVPYGGMVVGTPIVCTKPPGMFLYWFAPLYFSLVPITGDLLGLPAVRFPFYNLTHSGQWALGFMTKTAAACVIGVCPYCVSLPAIGTITPYTGTSL